MNSTQYSIAADSRRWWWPSAAVGAAAVATAVAIPVTAGHAFPVDRPPASSGTDRGSEVVMTVATGGRTCVMGAADWDVAAHGPQPVCGTWPTDRRAERPDDCPPPPDIRYVGVPWVPYEPTGCPSIDRWWTMADQ